MKKSSVEVDWGYIARIIDEFIREQIFLENK